MLLHVAFIVSDEPKQSNTGDMKKNVAEDAKRMISTANRVV